MKHFINSNAILLVSFTFLFSLFLPTLRAHADLLGSWTYTHVTSSGPAPHFVALTPTYWFSPVAFDSFPPPSTTPNLYENLVVGPQDIGTTWTLTAADDPDFNAVTGLLTDGSNSRVAIAVFNENGGFSALLSTESHVFFGLVGFPEIVDFAGSTIDAFTLTLDDFILSQNAGNNISTATFTLGVHGTIPGSGGIALLAGGIVGFCRSGRRRRRG